MLVSPLHYVSQQGLAEIKARLAQGGRCRCPEKPETQAWAGPQLVKLVKLVA